MFCSDKSVVLDLFEDYLSTAGLIYMLASIWHVRTGNKVEVTEFCLLYATSLLSPNFSDGAEENIDQLDHISSWRLHQLIGPVNGRLNISTSFT